MKRALRGLGIVGVAACLTAAPAPGTAEDTANSRIEMPLRDVVLSNKTHRYAVPIMVGGMAMDAGLDTGSVGLRVLGRAVTAIPLDATSHKTAYSYGSGTRLNGVIAHTAVGFGTLSGPTTVHVVQTIDCRPDKADCPAAHADPATFGIQGDGLPGEGFSAILGINMGDNEVPNPLVKLGVKRWIVELPRPGDTAPGKLILNPTVDETAGYVMFPVIRGLADSSGGAHDAVDGCLADVTTRKTVCGAIILDSGAPGIRMVTADREKPWSDGDSGQIVFVKDGKPGLTADFTVGRRDEASRFSAEGKPELRVPHLYAGLLPYFAFDVLYDPEHGRIGLKPR